MTERDRNLCRECSKAAWEQKRKTHAAKHVMLEMSQTVGRPVSEETQEVTRMKLEQILERHDAPSEIREVLKDFVSPKCSCCGIAAINSPDGFGEDPISGRSWCGLCAHYVCSVGRCVYHNGRIVYSQLVGNPIPPLDEKIKLSHVPLHVGTFPETREEDP